MSPQGVGRRIVVVGSTAAGKTSLASDLSSRLGIPHIELDALHWEAGWAPAATPAFRARVAEALAGDAWVVDGNIRHLSGNRNTGISCWCDCRRLRRPRVGCRTCRTSLSPRDFAYL